MRRHLPAAGAGVVLRSHSRKKHFEGGYAEHKAKCAVAIIRINPVDTWAKEKSYRGANRFVSGDGNLEVDFVLALQWNVEVVKHPREYNRAVNANQVFVIETVN